MICSYRPDVARAALAVPPPLSICHAGANQSGTEAMDGATEGTILLRQDEGGVATLTLNRPQARNALSRAMMGAIEETLASIATDRSVHAVVLAAAGPVYCAGHDLKELRSLAGADALGAVFRQCSRMMQAIVALPQPVIAAVQGMATAAGCQLVATCDLAVAAASARFATPGVNIGLFCSTPMVALSRAVGRKAAMHMLLTGEPVDAPSAERLGLVNRVVPDAELMPAAAALARSIAAKSPLTVATGKVAFYRQAELPLADAYDHAAEVMTRNMLAHDAEEGIDAFLAKRPPVWCGA
jgi:enoyl-CoA hydratase/carnithine racemase